LFVSGEQQQARSLRAVRTDNDRLGFLQMRVAPLIEIESADDAAGVVHLDAMDIGIRSNLATTGPLRQRDNTRKRAGLRTNFATEAPAKAAIDASTPPGPRLRKNRHRCGKWVVAKFAGTALEKDSGRFYGQRRHRIRFRTRRIERTRIRQTGNSNL